MLESELAVLFEGDPAQLEGVVEACCAAEGLRITLKGTLAKYPGCAHWHVKRDARRGTLEITLWPRQRRLWFNVQAGRTGDWIEETAARLKQAMEKEMGSER